MRETGKKKFRSLKSGDKHCRVTVGRKTRLGGQNGQLQPIFVSGLLPWEPEMFKLQSSSKRQLLFSSSSPPSPSIMDMWPVRCNISHVNKQLFQRNSFTSRSYKVTGQWLPTSLSFHSFVLKSLEYFSTLVVSERILFVQK